MYSRNSFNLTYFNNQIKPTIKSIGHYPIKSELDINLAIKCLGFIQENIFFFSAPYLEYHYFYNEFIKHDNVVKKFRIEIENSFSSIKSENLFQRDNAYDECSYHLFGNSLIGPRKVGVVNYDDLPHPSYENCFQKMDYSVQKILALLEFNSDFFNVINEYRKNNDFLEAIDQWYEKKDGPQINRDVRADYQKNRQFYRNKLKHKINMQYFAIPYEHRVILADDFLSHQKDGWLKLNPDLKDNEIKYLQKKIIEIISDDYYSSLKITQLVSKKQSLLITIQEKEITQRNFSNINELKDLHKAIKLIESIDDINGLYSILSQIQKRQCKLSRLNDDTTERKHHHY